MKGIDGFDSLLKKINALGGASTKKVIKTSIYQAAKLIQGDAKELCPVNDGYLREYLFADVKEDGDRIEGRVFTNVEYAPYVEFGTGPDGLASKKEAPAKVLAQLSYKQDGWWVHESQIDAETAEKYHFYRMETDQGVFYYTTGQEAQPFLYPATNRNEAAVTALTAANLKKEIKRLGGK